MSLHVLTPLRSDECASAIRCAIPMALIESRASILMVRLGRHRVRLVLEDQKNAQPAYGVIRSKVRISSAEPEENRVPLEESMAQDMSLSVAIRSIVSALKPATIHTGEGEEVSKETL